MSKFLPCEWFAYVDRFYGNDNNKDAFDKAWEHHKRFNLHHWEHWVEKTDIYIKCELIPHIYVKEMVADWIGAGLAQGKPDVVGWYEKNKYRMKLHPISRHEIERLLYGKKHV